MNYYFPQHIIAKYSDHSHNDIYDCYENASEDMIKSEPLMFIWGNKTVHRNSVVDETTWVKLVVKQKMVCLPNS